MAHLKIYGQQTSLNEYVKMMLKKNADQAGIDLTIQEVHDWQQIVKDKVISLPTITLNGQDNLCLNKGENVHEFINMVTLKIINDESKSNMKKILVPTDFSETATNALIYARGMNSTLNGLIQLVHVHKPEAIYVESSPMIDERVEQIRRDDFDRLVNRINNSWTAASEDVLPIDGIFKVGFVAQELEKLCQTEEAEPLIVVGSVGASGPLKKIFGSVSTQIAKTSKSPVLIVPADATYNKISDLVFTLDNLTVDVRCLPKVLDFAAAFDAQVHLLHIGEQDVYPGDAIVNIARSSHPKLQVHFKSLPGNNPVEIIDQYAIQHSVDMIAMATQERGFFGDLFHKSITKNMALHTSIPLLILH